MCFLINGSSYSFETWLWLSCLKTPGCAETCKWKVVFSPKYIFSEMDHHTALKTCTIGIGAWKPKGALRLAPLNTKESNVISPNMCFLRNRPSNLKPYHCDWHAWKPQGALSWPSKYKGSWCFSPSNVFSHKWTIIQLWNLYHCGVIAQEVLKLPVIAQELLNNNDLYGYSARSTKRRPYKACSARSTII